MSAAEIVQRYSDGILSGEIVAGREQIAAVRRHQDDLNRAKKNSPYYFDQELAELAIAFLPFCCHTGGEWIGTPFVPSPFQVFIVWNLFGWRRHSDKLRRFRQAYISIARKNGKSTFVAVLLILLFILDGEPRSECYVAATKRDQAKIVWSEADRMIQNSPDLKPLVKQYVDRLELPHDKSFCKPVGSDSKSQDGYNAHAIVIDELHEWAKSHRGLWDKLRTCMGSRRQPLLLIITTAGDVVKVYFCKGTTCQPPRLSPTRACFLDGFPLSTRLTTA